MTEIEQLKNQMAEMQKKIEELEKAKEKNKDEIEFKEKEKILYIDRDIKTYQTILDSGFNSYKRLFESHNLFKSDEKDIAEETAEKIKFLLKLTYYKRLYDPAFKPDWNNKEQCKYFVYYNCSRNCFETDYWNVLEDKTDVYFGTYNIAQKICGILNKELNEKDKA